jgi:hypothetical protein
VLTDPGWQELFSRHYKKIGIGLDFLQASLLLESFHFAGSFAVLNHRLCVCSAGFPCGSECCLPVCNAAR